jgi:hypothetical protein
MSNTVGMRGINGRVVGASVISALVLGSGVGAQAAVSHKVKPKVRTVSISYTGGCGVAVSVAGNGVTGAPGACVLGATYQVAKKATEKYLSIAVTDQTGRPVSGSLWLSGGAGNAVNEPFCGALANYPMAQSSYTLDINAAADTGCPGVPTAGKIVIKYSNVPVK